MLVVVGIAVLVLLLTYKVLGFSLWAILATISTLIFAGRVIGYFCELKHVIALEAVGCFLTVVFQMLRKSVDWRILLITLLLRGVFLLVAYIDTKLYVYVKREEKM